MWYGAQYTVTIVLLVCLYVWEAEPDESRFTYNFTIEVLTLVCDIKVRVFHDETYSVDFIQISRNSNVTSAFYKYMCGLGNSNPKSEAKVCKWRCGGVWEILSRSALVFFFFILVNTALNLMQTVPKTWYINLSRS